jgi:hypothetical protein
MKILLLPAITILAVIAPSKSPAQGWVESQNGYIMVYDAPTVLHNGFAVVPGPNYSWSVIALDYFVVTGAATQEPSWRLLFQQLANDSWFFQRDFGPESFPEAGTVNNWVTRDKRSGANNFVHTGTSQTASRELEMKVTEEAERVFVPNEHNPPGGGGDN